MGGSEWVGGEDVVGIVGRRGREGEDQLENSLSLWRAGAGPVTPVGHGAGWESWETAGESISGPQQGQTVRHGPRAPALRPSPR